MDFSRLKLNEGIATSRGTQTSLDASFKSSENSKTSAAERFTRKSVVSAGKARGAAQPQTSLKSANTVMDSVDHLKNIQKQKEYTRLLESQKSDWRQELTEKAIDGVEREKHPFVTVMPTGDENLIQAVKQMRDGVKEKKSELRTEEAYDKKKDKKKERRGMDGGIDYKKQPEKKSTNKELGIRDFTDKEREERYKEFLKNRKKRLGEGVGQPKIPTQKKNVVPKPVDKSVQIDEFFGKKTVTPKPGESPSNTKSVEVGKPYPAKLNNKPVMKTYDDKGGSSTRPMKTLEKAVLYRKHGFGNIGPMKESFIFEEEIVEGYVSVEHGEVFLEGNAGPSTPVKVYIYPDGSKRIQPYMGGTGAVPRKGQASKKTKKTTQVAHFELEGEEQLDEGKKKCKDGYKYDKKKKKCVKKKKSSSSTSSKTYVIVGRGYGGGHHHHHHGDKPDGGDNNGGDNGGSDGGDNTGGTSVSEMFDTIGDLMIKDLIK
jgi:hypothetical protein